MKKNTEVRQQLLRGIVVSDKMEKTVVVECNRTYEHAVTSKVMKTAKRYKVHDENKLAKVGDTVEFYEGRPVSKSKYMYLARVVDR